MKDKKKLEEKIEKLNADISSMKDNQSEELTVQETEKSKLEQKLRESNLQIKSLETEKKELQRQSDREMQDLNSRINSLKNDLKKSAL